MHYDLFYQMRYLCSSQKDSYDFLEKLEHMSEGDIMQTYTSLLISSRNSSYVPDIDQSA